MIKKEKLFHFLGFVFWKIEDKCTLKWHKSYIYRQIGEIKICTLFDRAIYIAIGKRTKWLSFKKVENV